MADENKKQNSETFCERYRPGCRPQVTAIDRSEPWDEGCHDPDGGCVCPT